MSEISDKIREWCDRNDFNGHGDFVTEDGFNELFALADRIDAKMVELPQSADGKIWTGREVCFWTGPANEDWHKLCGLHYADGMWCVEDVDWERYPAVSVWYERPDSFERIADDIETFGNEADINDIAVEFLCKIQERIYALAKKEDQR